MKRLISILIVTAVIASVDARASVYTFSKNGNIHKAPIIIVVDIRKIERSGKSSAQKRAFANVERVIKGEVEDEIIIDCYGYQGSVCDLDTGRYLTLLIVEDFNYRLFNAGHSATYQIIDDRVNWYKAGVDRWPMEYQSLKEVLAEIESEIENPTWKEEDDML